MARRGAIGSIGRAAASLAAALACALASPAARADDAVALRDDGRCTPDVPEVSVAAADDAIDHFAIVSAPTLYLEPVAGQAMSPRASAAVEMHTPLLKVRTSGSRMLVRSRHEVLDGEALCAWIDIDDVLEFDQAPITVGTEIDWTDPVTGQTKTLENPLPLKALLRRNPDAETGFEAPRFHERPVETSSVRADSDAFGIYLIYAERAVEGDGFWYWMAGESPQSPTRFAGWVPAENVVLWETQMSLGFTDVIEGSAIYASRDSAASQDPSGVVAYHPGDVRYEESDGTVPVADDSAPLGWPFMPILLEEPSAPGRGETLFRVAVPKSLTRVSAWMHEGFVRCDEKLGNCDFWVNLTYDDLDLLSRFMQLTCRGFERSSVRRNIEQAMTLVTSTLGGEQYRPDIPVGEFLRRYLFLPANHFPSILESTPDWIEEQWQRARDADTRNGTYEATLRIADPICRSAELLGLAFDGKRLADPDTDLVRASSLSDDSRGVEYSWVVVDEDRILDHDWEWSQGGENNYFFLPTDFLPRRTAPARSDALVAASKPVRDDLVFAPSVSFGDYRRPLTSCLGRLVGDGWQSESFALRSGRQVLDVTGLPDDVDETTPLRISFDRSRDGGGCPVEGMSTSELTIAALRERAAGGEIEVDVPVDVPLFVGYLQLNAAPYRTSLARWENALEFYDRVYREGRAAGRWADGVLFGADERGGVVPSVEPASNFAPALADASGLRAVARSERDDARVARRFFDEQLAELGELFGDRPVSLLYYDDLASDCEGYAEALGYGDLPDARIIVLAGIRGYTAADGPMRSLFRNLAHVCSESGDGRLVVYAFNWEQRADEADFGLMLDAVFEDLDLTQRSVQ